MFESLYKNKIIKRLAVIFVVAMLVAVPMFLFAEEGPDDDPAWYDVQGQLLAFLHEGIKRIFAYMGAAALMISSWVLWASGALLKFILDYTVINMAENISQINGLDVAWRVFRDLANMFFIFIILYIAIGTILRLSGINTKKMLVNVVIIALLINFSLFFTKIIIDASNIVAIGFYNKITASAGGSEGLAGPFMQKMGMTNMFDIGGIVAEDDNDPNTAFSGGALGTDKTLANILIIGVMGSIFFLITAFVFFAANLLFIGRYVILIFLMILSPLAFASMALPRDKYSSRWWDKLFDQCLFAPAFMALIWVVLIILDGVIHQSNAKWTDAFVGTGGLPPSQDAVQLIMNFIIIITMIVACLIIAKQFGAYGAGKMLTRGTKLRQWAQGKIGRGTVGEIGRYYDKKLGGTRLGNSRVGRFARSLSTGAAANATFGSGTSRKQTYDEVKKLKTDIAGKRQEIVDKKIIEQGMQPKLGGLQRLTQYPMTAGQRARFQAQLPQQEAKLAQTFNKMSTKEIDSLKAEQIKKNIKYINSKHLEHILEKSEAFTPKEQDEIRAARFAPVKEAVESIANLADAKAQIDKIHAIGSPAHIAANKRLDDQFADKVREAKDRIKNLSNKEVELGHPEISTMKPEHYETFINTLSGGQIENMTKSDNTNYTATQKQAFKDIRVKPLKTAFNEGKTHASQGNYATAQAKFAEARKQLEKMGDKDRAKFDIDILTHPEMLGALRASDLKKMRNEMGTVEQRKLRDAIVSEGVNADTILNDPAAVARLSSEEKQALERIKQTADFLNSNPDQF